MKTCLICSNTHEDDAVTCAMCGEGSWSESAPSVPGAPVSVAPPMSRRDRRAAEEAERRRNPTASDVEAMADAEAEEIADGLHLAPVKPSA